MAEQAPTRVREKLVTREVSGYPSEIGAALWRLEDARDRTFRKLADLPEESIDKDREGNSVGTILYHVALIEADWLYSEILEQPIARALATLFPVDDRDQAGILSAVRGQTLQQHLARLATVRADLLDKLRGMSVDDFHQPRTLPNYDVSPAWVLHHLAQHEAEHRGELRP